MKYKTLQHSENLSSSYWLYPLTFAFFAFILLAITIRLDVGLINFYSYMLPSFDIDVLRKVLGIIITSSISITSVVFSITVLTLSLASSQLGPRLLPTFIRQGKTQLVIAIFIGIYVYCLLLLSISSMNTSNQYLSSFIFGIMLGFISFITLIFFINYVCKAIQLENFLSYLSSEVAKAISRSLRDKQAENNAKIRDVRLNCIHLRDIYSQHTGYIQAIDYSKLLNIAKCYQSNIEILNKPGSFLKEGLIIASISNKQAEITPFQTEINECFLVGINRTSIQDLEYGFEQIVEIAVRALSPGINNPYTAICCINQIGSLLTILSTKFIPHDYLASENFVVYFKQFTYQSIIDTSLEQLRFHAAAYCSVTITLLKMIKQVLSTNKQLEIELSLKKQAKIIFETAQKQQFHDSDLKDIETVYNQI